MRSLARLAILLLSAAAAAQENRFQRSCTIFSDPRPTSSRLCRKLAGDSVIETRPAGDGFVYVDTGDCIGYVRGTCLALAGHGEAPTRGVGNFSEPTPTRVRMGLALSGDGLFGRAPSSASGSEGLGFGVSVLAQVPIVRRFEIHFKPTYQYFKLSRTVGFAGIVSEPTQTEFIQRIPYAGFGLMGSYQVLGGEGTQETDWFVDGGAELLLPLSGRQADSTGDVFGFKPTSKLLLFVIGISTRIPIGRVADAGGFIQGYYNIASRGGASLYGIRLTLGISFRL